MAENGKLDQWHAYWLAEQILWLRSVGLSSKNLKVREHTKQELSHYSSATFDIDYEYPFGSKELAGIANRGQYDLTQHEKESKNKMEFFDEATKEKIIPRVIEPTFGVERIFLAVLTEAYNDDKKRGNIVLKLHPRLAPIKVGVFPIVANDKNVVKKAREVLDSIKDDFHCFWDAGGSIGRRYARQDEVGTPFNVTIDFESLEDNSVTIRNRDDTSQIRVPIKDLKEILKKALNCEKFESLGKVIRKGE